MVIVNPFGGEGAGKKLFLQIVEPLLLAAKISFTMKGGLNPSQDLIFISSLLILFLISSSY
jgi:hypothetical protein